MYFTVSVIFIPLGAVIFTKSRDMVSTTRLRYDMTGNCSIGAGPFNDTPPVGVCTVPFNIPKNITGTSYLYYGMVNFYQNARTYVSSRDFSQLRGDNITLNQAEDSCDPLVTDENGTLLVPCGLVAQSQFNDSFELCRDEECNNKIDLHGTNIAWEIDRERRFKGSPFNTKDQNDTIENEDFMVWMRTSTYRNWKKLYRRIETDLENDTYYLRATSKYPVEGFGGQKFFFISETTWFGGPNEVLGISYLVVGGVTFLLATIFLIRSRTSQDLDLPPETAISLEGMIAEPKYGPMTHLADDDRQLGDDNA